MLQKLSIICLLSLLAAVCSNGASISTHIVGGLEADIAEFPYQVSIRLESATLLHICGGSIYAPKIILTAAHCIKGRFASYIRIVAGNPSIADPEDHGIRASKLIPHKGYNKKTHENDIGLIILREALEYSNVIQPLPLAVDYPAAGAHAVVSGWGKRTETSEALPALLHAVDVHIVDQKDCGMQYLTKQYTITEQMLCAGLDEGGKDACQGDSGGPLVVDDVLVGVVSWGVGCAREGFPGVYASVTYHADWIEQEAAPYLE